VSSVFNNHCVTYECLHTVVNCICMYKCVVNMYSPSYDTDK